jgi:hypothetical protein
MIIKKEELFLLELGIDPEQKIQTDYGGSYRLKQLLIYFYQNHSESFNS